MKRPRATLRVQAQPHLGRDVRRYEVDCKYSTTGLTQVPVPAMALTDEMLILIAGTAHEERCGRCDVSAVLAKGDQDIRRVVDEEWGKFQAMTAERMMRGRRN